MSSLFCRAFSVKPSVFNEFEIVPYHESFCVITLLACANWTTHLRLPPPPPPHPYISLDIFKSAIFISGYGFRPHVSGESGMRIRSLEWKFFMKRCESGIVCTLNPDIISSGGLSKIEPSSLPWMLYSRWQPRSQVLSRQSKVQIARFTTHALLPIFSEEFWVREWIWIRVGYVWTGKFDLHTGNVWT